MGWYLFGAVIGWLLVKCWLWVWDLLGLIGGLIGWCIAALWHALHRAVRRT